MKPAPFAALVASALVSTAIAAAPTKPADYIGKAVPSFSVKTLDGKTISSSKLKGKVTVLDFWATWCTNCIKASPTMQKLQDEYGAGIQVIGMNAKETKPRPAATTDYVKKHGYTYTFVSNADAAHKAFKAVGLPIIVVVDKQGVVKAVFDDFDPAKTPDQLESAIKSAM